jgi:hypothetical protein
VIHERRFGLSERRKFLLSRNLFAIIIGTSAEPCDSAVWSELDKAKVVVQRVSSPSGVRVSLPAGAHKLCRALEVPQQAMKMFRDANPLSRSHLLVLSETSDESRQEEAAN